MCPFTTGGDWVNCCLAASSENAVRHARDPRDEVAAVRVFEEQLQLTIFSADDVDKNVRDVHTVAESMLRTHLSSEEEVGVVLRCVSVLPRMVELKQRMMKEMMEMMKQMQAMQRLQQT